jgi:hypothetical protein
MNPEERRDDDPDKVQMVSSLTETTTTPAGRTKVTPTSSAPKKKGKGRNARVEGKTASAGGEQNTASGSQSVKRGRGRPRKVDQATPVTIIDVDHISTDTVCAFN